MFQLSLEKWRLMEELFVAFNILSGGSRWAGTDLFPVVSSGRSRGPLELWVQVCIVPGASSVPLSGHAASLCLFALQDMGHPSSRKLCPAREEQNFGCGIPQCRPTLHPWQAAPARLGLRGGSGRSGALRAPAVPSCAVGAHCTHSSAKLQPAGDSRTSPCPLRHRAASAATAATIGGDPMCQRSVSSSTGLHLPHAPRGWRRDLKEESIRIPQRKSRGVGQWGFCPLISL